MGVTGWGIPFGNDADETVRAFACSSYTPGPERLERLEINNETCDLVIDKKKFLTAKEREDGKNNEIGSLSKNIYFILLDFFPNIYTHTHIYIYTYYTYTYIRTYIYICVCVCVYIYKQIFHNINNLYKIIAFYTVQYKNTIPIQIILNSSAASKRLCHQNE